jgi:SAM-dependent methyltransferase
MKKQYYCSLCSLFYDLDKPVAPKEETDFYLSFAKKPDKILEPMCGSGRILLNFAKLGFNIEGFDISADMLERCKQALAETGRQIKLSQDSFGSYAATKKFDHIFIASSSVCLLTKDKDLTQGLELVYSLLKEGGLFVFGIETLQNLFELEQGTSVRQVCKGETVVKLATGKPIRKSTENVILYPSKYELFENGELITTQEEDFLIRYHDPNGMDALLTRLGFKILHKYSDYDFTEFNGTGDKCLYVVRKD